LKPRNKPEKAIIIIYIGYITAKANAVLAVVLCEYISDVFFIKYKSAMNFSKNIIRRKYK